MLGILLPILFFGSVVGVGVMIGRKIPALTQIPQESIANQESFLFFAARVSRAFFSYANPKRIKMYVLGHVATFLNKTRVFFLKMYYIIETAAKKARQESQKLDWEHNWFSSEHRIDEVPKEEKKPVHEKDA